MSRVFVLAEDRREAEVGLRFALASLIRFVRTEKVVLYWPHVDAPFREWALRFTALTIVADRPEGASSWNCKPHAMLPLLRDSADEVIWLDADILVARDPRDYLDALSMDEFVGTEEPAGQHQPNSSELAAAWGFRDGRRYSTTLNSSVLRATRAHLGLLEHWRECLDEPAYRAAQALPMERRPLHLMSDQHVLFALIGSSHHDGVPLKYMRGGREIVHCGGAFGYSASMRIKGVARPMPMFFHAIAGKPWWILTDDYRRSHSAWFTFYRRLLQETSPYVVLAREMRNEVEMDCPWLDYTSAIGFCLRVLSGDHFALCGLPLVAMASLGSTVGRLPRRIGTSPPLS